MFNSFLSNMNDFLYSLPTILGVIVIIAIVLNIVGAAIRTIVRISLRFLIITILLGFFGISLPSPMQILGFISSMGSKVVAVFK